jgi:hypothetical protein
MITPLLFALSAVLQGAASEQALLHSAETVLLVEVPDVPKLLEAYRNAPIVRMVGDETVQETVLDVLDAFDVDLSALVEQALTRAGAPAQIASDPAGFALDRLRSVQSLSFSSSADLDRITRLRPYLGQRIGAIGELKQLAPQVQEYIGWNGVPDSLAEVGLDPDILSDPWGHPYVLRHSDADGPSVWCLGADGVEGGESANRDFSSAEDIAGFLAEELPRVFGTQLNLQFTSSEAAAEAFGLLLSLSQSHAAQVSEPESLTLGSAQAEVVSLSIVQAPQVPLWMLRSGTQLVVGAGSATAGGFAARLADSEGTSCAATSFYRDAVAGLPAPSGATVIQAGMSSLASLESLRGIDFESLSDPSNWDVSSELNLGRGAARIVLDGSRFITEIAADFDQADSTGPLGGAVAGQPLAEDLWTFPPPDAIGVIAVSLDGPGLYAGLLGAMTKDSNRGQAEKKLADLEQRHGFNLEKDIFGGLGRGLIAYLLPIRGATVLPEVTVAAELRDSEAFARGLNGLLGLLAESSQGALQVGSKSYRDAPIWTFGFAENGLAAVGFAPSLTIVNDHLLITLTSLRAKREIKRALKGELEPHPLTSGPYRPPVEATAFAYLDWQTLLNGIYESARGAVGLMAAMGGELPIDATALPEGTVFTRFFEPTMMWYRPTERGLRAHVESSFGPEALLGLTSVGAGAFLGVRGGARAMQAPEPVVVDAEWGGPEVSSELAATHDALSYLASRLKEHELEQKRFPSTLAELAQPTQHHPRGFLDGAELPKDGWGRAIEYALGEDGYTLWSLGPDGVDQRGAGDDILGG